MWKKKRKEKKSEFDALCYSIELTKLNNHKIQTIDANGSK
jgi:hypothetical protein